MDYLRSVGDGCMCNAAVITVSMPKHRHLRGFYKAYCPVVDFQLYSSSVAGVLLDKDSVEGICT
jgi:hypothetical protein